jgi:ergothioneine biosynthesis protein EgtB
MPEGTGTICRGFSFIGRGPLGLVERIFMQVAIQPLTDLAQRYRDIRAHSARLAAVLSAEDAQVQSMPDASPVKWHLAHTSWFFETVILAQRPGYRPFDPNYTYLFNSYYEAIGPRHPRPRRGLLTRPSLDQVMAYRAHVDAAMMAACGDAALADLITLGLNHEQQHQELILTDIKHAFFSNPLLPAYSPAKPGPQAERVLDWLSIPAGTAWIGHEGLGFSFDNERPRHEVLVRPFRIASRPVSNGEYRAFIADGGYRRAEFWLSDGWTRVQEEGWDAPLYWLKDDDGSAGDTVFTLSGVQPLDSHAPLEHVSFYEAAAYAAWAGARLPTEFEWEVAAPLFSHGPNSSMGEVWEWTRSSYDPYPGFKPLAGAVAEYNGKFMVGQMVLRGGSSATPPGHIRASYRNFFPPQARWQFSGIRLAEDA